jgi:hypothetical protein
MRASSSAILLDQFNDDDPLSDKRFYSSSSLHTTDNYPPPFFDHLRTDIVKKEDLDEEQSEATSTSNCPSTTPLQFNPDLATLIEKELGLNESQTNRKNAWGNLSYAELIAKAIENSEERRLTLSQIYLWMIQYVPYFRDKGDRKSSTGWKNSIRHNLSLHNRFVRIPNEVAGKSSWWTVDPRAKQVRGRRRIQSSEGGTKNERRRLGKTTDVQSSFDYLLVQEQIPSSSSDVFTSNGNEDPRTMKSVRDINRSLYNLLENQSLPPPAPTILHDMLKSSSSPSSTSSSINTPVCTSTTHDNNSFSGFDSAYSSLSKSPFNEARTSPPLSSSSSVGNTPSPSQSDDQLISSRLKNIDRSSPLFRRMVLAIMRHQMSRTRSTPTHPSPVTTAPTTTLFSPPSMEIDNPLPSSTFDLDVEAILDFERTTFGDCSFDIHDLPNL